MIKRFLHILALTTLILHMGSTQAIPSGRVIIITGIDMVSFMMTRLTALFSTQSSTTTTSTATSTTATTTSTTVTTVPSGPVTAVANGVADNVAQASNARERRKARRASMVPQQPVTASVEQDTAQTVISDTVEVATIMAQPIETTPIHVEDQPTNDTGITDAELDAMLAAIEAPVAPVQEGIQAEVDNGAAAHPDAVAQEVQDRPVFDRNQWIAHHRGVLARAYHAIDRAQREQIEQLLTTLADRIQAFLTDMSPHIEIRWQPTELSCPRLFMAQNPVVALSLPRAFYVGSGENRREIRLSVHILEAQCGLGRNGRDMNHRIPLMTMRTLILKAQKLIQEALDKRTPLMYDSDNWVQELTYNEQLYRVVITKEDRNFIVTLFQKG